MMYEFIGTYRFDGREWVFTVRADNFDDAHARLSALCLTGRIDGVVRASIPLAPGRLSRFIAWIRGQA